MSLRRACCIAIGTLCLCAADVTVTVNAHTPFTSTAGVSETKPSKPFLLRREKEARARVVVGPSEVSEDDAILSESLSKKLDAMEVRIENKLDQELEERLTKRLQEVVGNIESASHEDGSRVPKFRNTDGTMRNLTLFERLRYLEQKVDGGTNWLKDPQLHNKIQHKCRNQSMLGTDHWVCFDGWQHPQVLLKRSGAKIPHKCVVYDLGIRANPEFGVNLMKNYGCAVRAYDPSPTAVDWWQKNAGELTKKGDMYKFFPVGAGGKDGTMELFEYNWQQVSIVKAENDETKRPEGSPDLPPEPFRLPVKTLSTMMAENGDSYIDVLKIDIEGSEYSFLQETFDHMGCPPVGQIALEWHNFDLDERYGTSAQLNTLHNLLNTCGFQAFFTRDHWRASPEFTQGSRVLPPTRITLSSFCKDCLVELAPAMEMQSPHLGRNDHE